MERLMKYYEMALTIKKAHPLDLDTANFIANWIDENYIFRMLEIGSGIGFSANYLALNTKMTSITSLEKDFGYYMEAKKRSLSEKIEFIWTDFREFDTHTKYPLIFLDASKYNQIELFNKAKKFLKAKGTIIIDNIYLRRVRSRTDKKALKIIKKSEEFKEYLLRLEDFKVKIADVGDGVAICQKID